MGSWGFGLFEDDVACDVRDDYRSLLEDGVDDEEAARRILERYDELLSDEQDGPVVWLALATSQSEVGRLTRGVRDSALAVIDSDEDLNRWDEGETRMKRSAVLDGVRTQLLGPQRRPKRVRRPKRRYVTDLQRGDVLLFQGSNGRHALVRVARVDEDGHSIAPILKVLNYSDHLVPEASQIAFVADRQKPDIDPPPSPSPPWWTVDYRPEADEGIDYREAGFHLVANVEPKPGDDHARAWTSGPWRNLARGLERDLLSEDAG